MPSPKILFLLLFLLDFSYRKTNAMDATNYEASIDTSEDKDQMLKVMEKKKTISLKIILEQGQRLNPEEKAREFQRNIVEIDQKKNFDKTFLPQIGFTINTENQRVHSLYSEDNLSTSTKNPQGFAGLEIKNYTLFNWGKDYLNYQIFDESYKRERNSLDEKRRTLKHFLIKFYFQLIQAKHNERIAREFVRHASYIYRLAKEQSSNQKIRRGEYLQTRSLYLWAQQNYFQKRRESNLIDRQMASLINDDSEAIYYSYEELKFKKFHADINTLDNLIEENNSSVKDQKTLLTNAERTFQISNIENLPLPKFTLNFGTYAHAFSGDQGGETNWNSDREGPGGKNIEIRAGIQLTWSLIGENGFFNNRLRDRAFNQLEAQKTLYKGTLNTTHNQLKSLTTNIVEYEREWEVAEPLLSTSQKKFDQMLDQFMERKVSFLDLKEAIFDLKESEEWVQRLKVEHLKAKVDLAEIVGIDDFPGENFELLATEVKNEK